MAVCPVCGCKTEELDFTNRLIENKEFKICSFCDRQLKALDGSAELTEAQIRWLNAVMEKDVPARSREISVLLKSFGTDASREEIAQPVMPKQTPPTFVVPQGDAKKAEKNYSNEANVIRDLQNRITALENELRTMKRKQMIKTIIELGAPGVLLILLIIILLASGLIDNFKTIFDMAGITI